MSAPTPTPAPTAHRSLAVEPQPALSAPPPRRRRSKLPWLLIIPSLAILIAALGYPVGWQIYTSFHEYGLLQQFGQSPEFVGVQNYAALLGDPNFWVILGRSLLFCVLAATLTVFIGFLFAVLMKRVGTVFRLVLQVSMLLAWAMPVVASMTVWVWLVDWRRGLVNWLLERVGVEAAGHNWLADPGSFFVIALVIVVWMSVPFVALSIYAGLTQIPDEVLEAAAMDGASGIQRIRFIILPVIAPVISIVLLLQLIWDLRVFTQIKLLQDAGGVANETHLLGTYIYQMGVGSGDFGTASAVSILMLLITVLISWYYVRSLMKEENA